MHLGPPLDMVRAAFRQKHQVFLRYHNVIKALNVNTRRQPKRAQTSTTRWYHVWTVVRSWRRPESQRLQLRQSQHHHLCQQRQNKSYVLTIAFHGTNGFQTRQTCLDCGFVRIGRPKSAPAPSRYSSSAEGDLPLSFTPQMAQAVFRMRTLQVKICLVFCEAPCSPS